MRAIRTIALLLSLLCWIAFFAAYPFVRMADLLYVLLIPALAAFTLGVASFYKINNRASLFASLSALLLSMVLGLFICGMFMVGSIVEIGG